MADPQAATLTQLRNVQARTGKTLAELLAAVRASGLARHGERRSWLMEQFGLGYGDANAVAQFIDKPLPDLTGGAPAALPPAPLPPLLSPPPHPPVATATARSTGRVHVMPFTRFMRTSL